MELFAAVATLTAEDVACHAARVHAHQHGFVFGPRAFVEDDVFQSVALLAEGNDMEVSVGCRHVGFYATLHERLLLEAIGDEVANADNLQIVLASHFLELWHTRHGAVLVEDFNQGSCRLKS